LDQRSFGETTLLEVKERLAERGLRMRSYEPMKLTETEWWTCGCYVALNAIAERWRDDRRLRLFACACCLDISDLMEDPRSRQAVEVAERMADGLTTQEEVDIALSRAREAVEEGSPDAESTAAQRLLQFDAWNAAEFVSREAKRARFAVGLANWQSLDRRLLALLHDIFGNPFRPPTLNPAWRSPDLVRLARGIYETHDFQALPILADVCRDAEVANAA
jgi:hypothetical protein